MEYVDEIKDNFYAGEDYMNYVKDIINKTNFSGSVAAKSTLKKMGQPAQTPPIRKYPIAFQQMSLLTKNQAIRLPLRPKRPTFGSTKSSN